MYTSVKWFYINVLSFARHQAITQINDNELSSKFREIKFDGIRI